MPSAPPEQSDIRRRGRQRLIGAVALALVAALVVPMVLDADPRPPARDPVAAIPDRNLVAPLPAPEPAAVAAASPTEPPAPASAEPAEKAASSLAASPAATAEVAAVARLEPVAAAPSAPPKPRVTATAEAPAKAPAKAPAPALAGFAVQAGAFRDDVRLAQARKTLTAAGIRHYTERIEAKGGDLTRLRAGPFADREAATAAAARMKAAGLDATIVSLP